MELLMVIVFIIGYAAIALEHVIHVNKAASALITGVALWAIYALGMQDSTLLLHVREHLGEIAEILFFLLGAMTIVELIDTHNGFDIITKKIVQTNKRKLLWTIAFITFFMSAVLDNLTTTIVMVTLLRKLFKHKTDRLFFAGIVIIAANSGGAWSPIGDVTTTMLWIGNQITAGSIIIKVIIPSIISLIVPLLILTFIMKGDVERLAELKDPKIDPRFEKEKKIIFYAGVAALLNVPVFKTVTHLPPYMGMMIGLGFLWVLTELMHKSKDDKYRSTHGVTHALERIDTASILFFLGILIAVASLQTMGTLSKMAVWLDTTFNSESAVVMAIGLLSAIVDNVPLVAAAQGMYSLADYPTNHFFWEFLAYCAGTGGSILVIGSAAGVAAMGIEKIDFFWYLRKISLLALIGYFAGAFAYILQHAIIG